jgi:hypothetical protein
MILPINLNLRMYNLMLLKSLFVRNQDYRQPLELLQIPVFLMVKHKGNFLSGDNRAEFRQTIQTAGAKEMPFSLDVEFSANFSMESPLTTEQQTFLIERVFPQLVYPHSREFITRIIEWGGFPPLLITSSFTPNLLDTVTLDSQEETGAGKWTH